MLCQPCIERCQTKGGCWGDESEHCCNCENCGCKQESPDLCSCSDPCFQYRSEETHQMARHRMAREGIVSKCPSCDHTVELNPADQMRAAGISPMI